jgi:hypothetical protein
MVTVREVPEGCRMIGKMKLTRRQEASFNGAPVAALKSGIQKYVRRAMPEKGLCRLLELDLFGAIEADEQAPGDPSAPRNSTSRGPSPRCSTCTSGAS